MTRSRVALLAVLVVGVTLRALVAAQGWLYGDDLTLAAQARAEGLGNLLLQPHDGHLMPGAWVVLRLLPPLNWSVALAVLIAGQVLAALAVAYAAARTAPGNAWWVTALYLLTPLTLPVTTWLSAAVNSLPLHAAAALWLAHGWLYLRRRRSSDLVVVVAAILLACLFSERALLLAPTSLLLLWAWSGNRHPGRLVPAFLVPTAVWATVYVVAAGIPDSNPAGAGPLALFTHGYVRGFLPTLIGAPWTWERWHPGPPFADPATVTMIAGALAAAVLLIWSVRRRGLAAMVVVFAYPVLALAALAWGRSAPDTAPEIAQTLRHFAEVSVLLVLTLGVLAGEGRRHAVVAAVVAVSSLVSTATYAQSWSEQPAREYFTTLRAELEQRREPILDQPVALEVLLPVTYPYNQLSALLPEGQVTGATQEPTLVDASGHLIAAELAPARATAWEPGCVEPGSELLVPLDGPLFERDWVVRLNVLAAGATGVAVGLGEGQPTPAQVPSGLSEVFVRVSGGGDTLRVSARDQTVCLGQNVVGQLAVTQ